MDENKSVISGEFDRSGRYDAGLKSLAGSLRAAFILLLAGIIGTLIYFFSGAGYFSVEPQQAVIVLRFGKIIETFTTGGHWYLPYPVNQFIRVQTSQQLLDVDFTAKAVGPEGNAESLEPGRDDYLLTGDANIVHCSWTVAYRVVRPAEYYQKLLTPANPILNGEIVPDEEFVDSHGMKGTRGPQTFLRNLFRRSVISVTAQAQVNDILYAGQSAYSEKVRKTFADLVARENCGIEIDSVSLNRIFPPGKTKGAFDEVTAAGNTRSKLYNEAEAYRVEVQNDALATVAGIKADAGNYRKRVVKKLEAEKIYFEKISEQHLRHGGNTVPMALYTAVLGEIGQNYSDKIIIGSQGKKKQLWLKLNPEPKKSAAVKPNGGEEK